MSHLPAITAKDCHDCILDGCLSSPSTPTWRDTEVVPLKLCLQLESTLPNKVQRSQEVTLSWNSTKASFDSITQHVIPNIPNTLYSYKYIYTYKHHSGSDFIVVSLSKTLSSKLALLCLKEKLTFCFQASSSALKRSSHWTSLNWTLGTEEFGRCERHIHGFFPFNLFVCQ